MHVTPICMLLLIFVGSIWATYAHAAQSRHSGREPALDPALLKLIITSITVKAHRALSPTSRLQKALALEVNTETLTAVLLKFV